MLKKLWEMIYGRKPDKPKVLNVPTLKDKPAEKPAEAADQNRIDVHSNVVDERKVADDLSDYADNAFEDDDDKEDDWDVDFGDNDVG